MSFSEIKKEDALLPEVEATYLRYLYGEDAPQAQAVSRRLETTAQQRRLEAEVVRQRLEELMYEQSEQVIQDGVYAVLAVPQPEDIDPAGSHLWRRSLADRYAEAYYAKLLSGK